MYEYGVAIMAIMAMASAISNGANMAIIEKYQR